MITACHPVLCPLYLEPSLTLHNILSVCEGVTDSDGLGLWLYVPASKRVDISSRYQTDSERVEAVVKEWRAHHPAPSWKDLAWALYMQGELRALRRLYGKYLTGMSCDLMSLQLLCWKGCVFSLDCVWIIHLYMNIMYHMKTTVFNTCFQFQYLHTCTCMYNMHV